MCPVKGSDIGVQDWPAWYTLCPWVEWARGGEQVTISGWPWGYKAPGPEEKSPVPTRWSLGARPLLQSLPNNSLL